MSHSSTSVRVRYAPGLCPKSLAQAAVQLAPFGDIARLDVTLGPTSGCVLVTYFDVRAADEVLRHFGDFSETFPPAAHDFRSITIPPAVITEMPATFHGFQAYGEVAGVAMCGDEMVVDFYDMRSAQQVLMCLPGSRPKPQNYQMSVSQAEAALIKNRSAGFEAMLSGGIDPSNQLSAMMNQFGSLGLGLPDLTGTTDELGDAAIADTTDSKRSGKPVRDKVSAKDLSKFEIMPEKIINGEDPRTTVMFRNIPKVCSRESFVGLLERDGLGERYTFFYMPFDKRRNIHCGFAFVNFKAPQDVLQLYESTQTSFWRSLSGGQNAMPPAVSYARLQGQEQLMRHFSLSAVMYDTDVQKRPQFLQNQNAAMANSTDEVEDAPAKVMVTPTSEKLSPQYIQTSSMIKQPPGLMDGKDDDSYDTNFNEMPNMRMQEMFKNPAAGA